MSVYDTSDVQVYKYQVYLYIINNAKEINMFNPSMIFQMKSMWERFERNHPKFPRFLQVVGKDYIQEGTILEITATRADGEKITSNIRLTGDDMDLIRTLTEMGR